MRKSILLPAVAAAGGAVGFGLRLWELRTAFEPDTGLHIAGSPATWALAVLSAVMAVLLAALSRGCRSRCASWDYDQAFSANGNVAYITCMILSAFALLGAAVWMAAAFLRRENTAVVRLILAAMCIFSALCVLSTGKNNYRGEGRGKYSFPLLMPAYTCCVWLIAAYQARAGDPVQLDYIYELLAIITALLGLYFTAGFSFERPKAGRSVLFSLLGVYFSVVTLADGHSLSVTLLYGFVILMPLASTITLLRNTSRPTGQAAGAKETDTDMEAYPDEP